MTDTEYTQAIYNLFARIVGCAFRSYNYWHSDVDELCYEAGMYIELEDEHLHPKRQEDFPIYYKGRPTPVKRKMDLVAHDPALGDVILELKAINYVGDEQRKQLWAYMKLTGIRYGMLINFGPEKVYSENWMLEPETGKCHRI